MQIRKYRDLTLIDINSDQIMVISCDSLGGIGNKEHDVVKTSPEISGYFTTQVALMELIAFGVKPITIVNTLSVEMEDTGKRIIDGIEKALKPLAFDTSNLITGSTEENIPVTTTGMGMTIVGIIEKDSWEKPTTYPGLMAAVVGLPKVGDQILADKGKTIMDISKLLKLMEKEYIKEILPVGSKGILYELNEMAKTNGVDFQLEKNIDVDLKTSGGPSTCVIISMEEDKYMELKEEFPIPINKIGKFI